MTLIFIIHKCSDLFFNIISLIYVNFTVYALFNLFVSLGKPMVGVPVLFAVVILIAGVLGDVVARFYSDPLNSLLRNRSRDKPNRLGLVVNIGLDPSSDVASKPLEN